MWKLFYPCIPVGGASSRSHSLSLAEQAPPIYFLYVFRDFFFNII